MVIKNFSVRIDKDLLSKIHIVSAYNCRSINKQIISLIKLCISEHKKQHGEIAVFANKKDYPQG